MADQTRAQKLISIDHLTSQLIPVLKNLSLNDQQAHDLLDVLIQADRAGVTTHGLLTLSGHVNRLKDQSYNTNPQYHVIRSGPAFAVIDADNAIGPLSARHCMQHAIEGARNSGIFTVFCRNANTFGPAFVYPRMAAVEGLIGMAISNSPAAMPVSGGLDPLLGTNPFAIAIPGKQKQPIEFDMATSIVAKSKLNEARLRHESIPDNWALNRDGKPTTDPDEAIHGLILPMAEHKGVGLAMSIDIIAGVLSGASWLNHVGKFYGNPNAMNVGQTFIAIDPVVIHGEDFYQLIDQYQIEIRQSRPLEGQTIHIPGDGKHGKSSQIPETLVPLNQEIINKLSDMMQDMGFALDLPVEA